MRSIFDYQVPSMDLEPFDPDEHLFLNFFFKKLITYMETSYGCLWYAAGNPSGFWFGAVNRPSPPLNDSNEPYGSGNRKLTNAQVVHVSLSPPVMPCGAGINCSSPISPSHTV